MVLRRQARRALCGVCVFLIISFYLFLDLTTFEEAANSVESIQEVEDFPNLDIKEQEFIAAKVAFKASRNGQQTLIQ